MPDDQHSRDGLQNLVVLLTEAVELRTKLGFKVLEDLIPDSTYESALALTIMDKVVRCAIPRKTRCRRIGLTYVGISGQREAWLSQTAPLNQLWSAS